METKYGNVERIVKNINKLVGADIFKSFMSESREEQKVLRKIYARKRFIMLCAEIMKEHFPHHIFKVREKGITYSLFFFDDHFNMREAEHYFTIYKIEEFTDLLNARLLNMCSLFKIFKQFRKHITQ